MMNKVNSFLLALSVFFLGSCYEPIQGEEVKHRIVKKFKVAPVSIHDEMSPRFRAVLENGDTVPTGENSRIGDTVSYIFYKKK
jgi:hypothetical protein